MTLENNPLIKTWSLLNSLIGKSFYASSYLDVPLDKDPNKTCGLMRILTSEEMLSFEVSNNSGGVISPPNPQKRNPLEASDLNHSPAYWLMTKPVYGGDDIVCLIEKVILSKQDARHKENPIKLIHPSKTPILYFCSEEHSFGKGEHYNQHKIIETLNGDYWNIN